MKRAVWEQHLLDEIADLKRRLHVAQTKASKQRGRAELWKLRALRKPARR